MGISFSKSFGNNDINYSHKLLDRIDKVSEDSVRNFAKNFLSESTTPYFHDIQIETCNRCNNDCPFCPANRNNDTRKPKFMDEQLFYSIIDQLRAMNYRGTISLFSNNEPLLDGRIFKFIEYVKKRLPNAVNYLYTNGILLNSEKFSSLVKSLDILVIDNYDDNFQLIPPVQEVLNNLPAPYDINSVVMRPGLGNFVKYNNSSNECDVRIDLRKKNQKLFNLSGTSNSPNRIADKNTFRPNSPCIYPFRQMIVRPDGTTAKCCNDPLTKMITGDLNTQSIMEVWRGKAYQEFRKEMYFNGRKNFEGCAVCDAFGLASYIPAPTLISNEMKRLAAELKIRKSLGSIYIFDTANLSKRLFAEFNLLGVEFDGFVSINNPVSDPNYTYVDLEDVIKNRGFILIPTPHYPDALFDYLQAAGYQYRRDYLIYDL